MAPPSELAERVTHLEAAQRRFRAWIAVLAALLVLGVVILPLARRTMSAGTYLVKSGGTTRASLGMAPTGVPALVLYDDEERIRVNLSMDGDGSPRVALTDATGRVRASLSVADNGVPNLYFTDDFGNVRAALGVPADGLPALVLVGDTGRVRYMTP